MRHPVFAQHNYRRHRASSFHLAAALGRTGIRAGRLIANMGAHSCSRLPTPIPRSQIPSSPRAVRFRRCDASIQTSLRSRGSSWLPLLAVAAARSFDSLSHVRWRPKRERGPELKPCDD
jgi:hypothetical protein